MYQIISKVYPVVAKQALAAKPQRQTVANLLEEMPIAKPVKRL
jgi:hypothetical protein